MKAKPNRYADSVCCICTGVACSARAMPENAGIYVSIENGPSMPSTASRTARAQRGARQSWSASGFTRRPSLLVRELRSLRDRKTGLRRGLESRQARRSRGRVVDPHKEAVTTRGAIASPGPKGWACKGAHALLRSRVKPSRLDPRPRLACAPLQTQRRPVSLPRRLHARLPLTWSLSIREVDHANCHLLCRAGAAGRLLPLVARGFDLRSGPAPAEGQPACP